MVTKRISAKKIGTKNIIKNKTKKQFLFNPENPKKSFDVYIDKNPKDTIKIKYTTLDDVKNTIEKLEKLVNDLNMYNLSDNEENRILELVEEIIRLDNKDCELLYISIGEIIGFKF